MLRFAGLPTCVASIASGQIELAQWLIGAVKRRDSRASLVIVVSSTDVIAFSIQLGVSITDRVASPLSSFGKA